MSKRSLSRQAFRAWLATKHPRTKVGVSCKEDSCPLAKFLTQTTGIPHEVDAYAYRAAVVENGKVVRDDWGNVEYGPEIGLPHWAQHFVEIVDNNEYRSVSAKRALAIARSNRLGRAAHM